MKTRNAHRGFSLIEILVIVAILGFLALAVMPLAGKAIRRARAIAPTGDINRVLTQARLQAIKRGFQVIAKVDTEPGTGRVRFHVWEDRNPDFQEGTYTPPGGGPPVAEVALQDYTVSATYRLAALKFDGYGGDNSKTGLLVFLPTGALQPPDASNSGLPTKTDGRGIYLEDGNPGLNKFRLTVYSNLAAKVKVEKWVEASPPGYYPDGWTWQ